MLGIASKYYTHLIHTRYIKILLGIANIYQASILHARYAMQAIPIYNTSLLNDHSIGISYHLA